MRQSLVLKRVRREQATFTATWKCHRNVNLISIFPFELDIGRDDLLKWAGIPALRGAH